MNRLNFFLIIASFIVCHQSLSAQTITVKKGLFHYVSNLGRKDSPYIHKIWINDSAVIQTAYSFFSCEINDSIIYEGYDPYKYTYYDLRTKKCQDYFSFSDTAQVECNYLKQAVNGVPYNIFRGLNWEGRQRTHNLKDTILNNKATKVIQLVEERPEYNYRFEENYYFQKNNMKSDAVNLDAVITRLFPDKNLLPEYTLVRIDNITYPEKIQLFADYYIARDTLTPEELKVFKQWKKNAMETTLPIISEEEVDKMSSVPIRFKNDPLCNPQIKKSN